MKNKEQHYDVAGYTVASKLLNLLVDKGIITTSEGTNIYNAATALLKDAPALKVTSEPGLQLEKLISLAVNSFPENPPADVQEHKKP
ncbi:hypothetical protein GXD79_06725 [Salmonella enterica]|nr:hypothetical protein [Salmonella enterica]ECG6805957.1 hypothetical protein [Salmonella enterica subsp. enterica serovar Muenchen]EBN4970377.1 hypothetical protein [Salmonella enterica]EDW7847309.1 hypothetical protein [Salmonella enterica]EEH2191268.1 hypothetical protein [Salmonella enterica]